MNMMITLNQMELIGKDGEYDEKKIIILGHMLYITNQFEHGCYKRILN